MSQTDIDNPYEHFVRLFTKNEASIRAFVRSMMPRLDHADDIMQEVSVVAWRKFESFAGGDSDEFRHWICTIARFEVLKFRRGLARDRLVLDEDVLALLADEGIGELSYRVQQREALDDCLQKLSHKHRTLVLQAYSAGRSIKELAEIAGRSPDSMYQALARIRAKLLVCIEGSIQTGTST